MRDTKNRSNKWLIFSLLVVVLFGVWGAFIDIPEKNGFPATLGYVVWSITMIPAALVALRINRWKLDKDKTTLLFGFAAGLLGAAGQLLLFEVMRHAPAYLVFPLIALTPVVTVMMALIILKEKSGFIGWFGIILSLIAGFLLSYNPGDDQISTDKSWIWMALIVMAAWGIQGFVLKVGNNKTSAESIFTYMAASALLLSPVAILMTNFDEPINWSFNGPGYSAIIQILNSFGALCIVYAFRYGKAIVVSPVTTALPPVATVMISLAITHTIPHIYAIAGIILAVVSAALIGIDESKNQTLS